MRLACLVLGLALVTLVSAKAVDNVRPMTGYHEAVGIPLATRIKAAEDAVFAKEAEVTATSEVRIVGGVIAPINAYPYLGGLVINFVNIAGQSACGSSLLSANRLVTAAHCWFDGNNQASQFTVVLGSPLLFSGGTRIPTQHVIMHPMWTPSTLANDVAMIYLPYNVFFSQAILPVALPSSTQLTDSFVGQWAQAAGYGKTNDQQTGVTTSSQVSHVTLQVISVAQCQATFGWWALDSNICTSGAGGVGICGGDSGGPLVVNQFGQNILVGISSFVAEAGCQLGHPSAFARVTSFYYFILQHLF